MSKSDATSSRRLAIDRRTVSWLLLAVLVVLFLLIGSLTYWRSSGSGPQVQVPMFYDAHYLFPRPWTQAQAAPGVPDPAPIAFFGENTISQSFRSGSHNLARVAFQLSGPEGELVKAALSDPNGIVRQAYIMLSGDKTAEYALSFPAIADSKGKAFTLALSAPQATAEKPVVAYTVGGDRLGDSLRLNEFIRPGNLALTTYAKGALGIWWFDALAEQMLPHMFRLRLQQYKPTLFKGPLFSWLLLLTIGLSAVLLVLSSPKLQSGTNAYRTKLAPVLGWFLVLVLGSFLLWQLGSGRAIFITGANEFDTGVGVAEPDDLPENHPRIAADLTGDLWTAVREPEARFISTETVLGYPAIKVPGGSRIEYAVTVPPESRLRLAPAAIGDGAIIFAAEINDELLFESAVMTTPAITSDDLSWQEIDLAPWSGQGVVLSLVSQSESGKADGLWLMPQIETDASWILSDLPDMYRPIGVVFGDTAELLGAVVDASALPSDGQLVVKLLWRPLQVAANNGKVFVHLIDGSNQLVAQHDAPPVQGAYPFSIWQPGTIIEDEHVLLLEAGALTSGPYRLEIGVYDPDTLQRWTAENTDGMVARSNVAVLDLPPEVLK